MSAHVLSAEDSLTHYSFIMKKTLNEQCSVCNFALLEDIVGGGGGGGGSDEYTLGLCTDAGVVTMIHPQIFYLRGNFNLYLCVMCSTVHIT